MLRWCVRLAFKSASCNNTMSALLRPRNSMTRSSCIPRLMFQHTTLTELGGKRTHLVVAKLPVSISDTEVDISHDCDLPTASKSAACSNVPKLIQQHEWFPAVILATRIGTASTVKDTSKCLILGVHLRVSIPTKPRRISGMSVRRSSRTLEPPMHCRNPVS